VFFILIQLIEDKEMNNILCFKMKKFILYFLNNFTFISSLSLVKLGFFI